MPLKIILRNPRAGLILTNALAAAVSNAVTFNIPLFFQAVMLESATSSGLRLLVPSLAASVSGTAAGFLITWTKHLKRYLVIGVVFSFLGSLGLSFLQRGWSDLAYLLFIVLSNIGQGLSTFSRFFFSPLFSLCMCFGDQVKIQFLYLIPLYEQLIMILI